MLTTKMVQVFTTTRCTLNCKYCGAKVPMFKKQDIRYDADLSEVCSGIDVVFNIYDHIEHLDFTGGEALLWPHLADCISYASKYREQFDFIRILTNGTLLPSDALIAAVGALEGKFDFFIDNYGNKLSTKVDELKRVLERENVRYREIHYDGDIQDYGGWIDFGDFSYKGYSEEQLNEVYRSCLQAQHMCITIFKNRLYNCSVSALFSVLGNPSSALNLENESINLLDGDVSIERKKDIAEQFGQRVLSACQYCNGFDADKAPRFPAAEQE